MITETALSLAPMGPFWAHIVSNTSGWQKSWIVVKGSAILPDHIPMNLGTKASQGTVLRWHNRETTCQSLHRTEGRAESQGLWKKQKARKLRSLTGPVYKQKIFSLELWFFSYPSVKACLLGAQKNRLIETVLLSTHNICFGWEIKKFKKNQLGTLISGGLISMAIIVLNFYTLQVVPLTNLFTTLQKFQTQSEFQTVWIQIMTNILSVLIWDQTVCKVHQQPIINSCCR